MVLNYESVEEGVKKLNDQSSDWFYWDGWTICRFTKSPAAMYDKDGVFTEQYGWGKVTRIEPTADGLWKIDG